MESPFKRVAIIGKLEDRRASDSMVAFAQHAVGRGLEVLVEDTAVVEGLPQTVRRVAPASLCSGCDLIVAIGGDGTMLHAARLALGSDVPLLGINRGRLGFLTDVSPSEMLERFDDVLAGRYEQDARTMLRARLSVRGQPDQECHALNDVVIQKQETGRLIEFETWIGERYVNTHGGDGLVIATSTGSTAYALSCGGPIIHPGLDALVLAPISPHTLSDRPIVVGRDSSVTVRLVARSPGKALVSYDGVTLGELGHEARLLVGPAERRITLLHPPGHDYYRILRSKLHWGRSGRNMNRET